MKKLMLVLICSSVFGVTSTALADPPPKSTILHCGCAVDPATGGATMRFVEITVSSKARGHLNHIAGSTDTCMDTAGQAVEFIRTSSDCSVSGAVIGDMVLCGAGQVAGAVCGQPDTQLP